MPASPTEPLSPPRLRGRDLLRAVAEGTAGDVGDRFLQAMVRRVAEALAAKLVLVVEATVPDGSHVRMLAGWYDRGPILEPLEYDTRGQPCALAPGQTVVAVPDALAERFPDDRAAIDLGLDSYLAVCLRDSAGRHLGHLAVLDSRRMEAGEEDIAALRIFAARAAAELERRNQAAALRASRARVVEAADAERRRLGRDLHDGAQQRLLAVSNLLRVARRKAGDGADGLLERAEEELRAAHAELRELARGLYPVALAERGLPAAVESLGGALPVPVEAEVCPDPLPDAVAAAAYFLAAEGLTNAARYAGASRVRVRMALAPDGEELRVEIADDGAGGADPSRGTGLRGLADRFDVLGGRLEVDSPPGAGTRIRASVPLAAPA